VTLYIKRENSKEATNFTFLHFLQNLPSSCKSLQSPTEPSKFLQNLLSSYRTFQVPTEPSNFLQKLLNFLRTFQIQSLSTPCRTFQLPAELQNLPSSYRTFQVPSEPSTFNFTFQPQLLLSLKTSKPRSNFPSISRKQKLFPPWKNKANVQMRH
jgi:hypothetical protein